MRKGVGADPVGNGIGGVGRECANGFGIIGGGNDADSAVGSWCGVAQSIVEAINSTQCGTHGGSSESLSHGS
ncbi:hypothetical protein MSAR_20980 [Mycolicibacterium sarraceniae]|uniref:Uncharacterized protein n=1 Tax=Mycolicibacterium sarraceniae TaxID=1534348 RepID=A0A7I7SPQ3_9MYCO|nr:hypothetical protein MSAR_20980 [Mycolicibacterium sarraceniae]